MKVILVSPYSDNLVGGIINWTKYIVSYQRESGKDVDMRLLNNLHAVGLYGTGNVFQRLKAGINNYLPIYRGFKEMVNTEHFDVVHVSSSAGHGLIRDLLITRYARKKGVKVAVHIHCGRIPTILQTRGLERTLFLCLLRMIDRAIVMDLTSYNALKSSGYENVSYLPNPLSTEVEQLIEKYKNTSKETRKIVFAGHVVESKGVFELVEACKSIENVKLELLGRVVVEDDKEKLFKLAGEEADTWLSIPGNKTLEEVIMAMKSCSVFALPTYSEGFPNVILESMACACTIVTTPVGAIPEMLAINGENPCGVCVPPKNVKELHDAIVNLLESEGKAEELSKNAVKRVHEEYVISKVWGQLTTIWRDITRDSEEC